MATLSALVLGAALAACGDDGADSVRTGAGGRRLADVEVTVATAATFAKGEVGVALVDGLAGEEGRRTTKVWLDADGERRELEAPDLPLNAVVAWFSDGRLLIDGLDCPQFSREALLADSGGTDLHGICGAVDRRTVALDLTTETWETLRRHPVSAQQSPALPPGEDGSLLLGAGRLWRPDGSEVELTGLPAEDEATAVSVCSSGPAPLAIVQPAPTGLALYRLVETRWQAVDVDVTDGLAEQSFRGCTDEGVVVAGVPDLGGELEARLVIADEDEGAQVTPLDLSAVSKAGLPSIRTDIAGTLVAGNDGGEWFAREADRWRSIGEVDLSEARQSLVADGKVLVIRNVFDRPFTIESL